MQLNDGICTFYRPDDGRGSGNFPGKTAKVLYSAWYGERTVGFSRFFTAQQANTRVDMLIRVLKIPRDHQIGAGDLCKVREGMIYRIVQAQFVRDPEAGVDCIDVSLERIGEKYELT